MENVIQKVQIVKNKIYAWNENIFRILDIKYTVDLENVIGQALDQSAP